ncbi:MAG: DNA polymerase III subunit delta' [Nitrospira sp. SB0677_bin_15]|nr:DNA polymerase III subunit delta' [Nitrospira sp. SB0667_bin_9]MYD30533.1 DNA polymerase III subunit delta' [Nitrospira sp. SB0661_bin_20]MYG39396.1 DNA polymerase III subunit delta' [Nitrospira sp. SB0677_bin_15]MYJ22780.1 DNA polymerase III subunit delta' [Nitrospira sp. SB0673_bin_12]
MPFANVIGQEGPKRKIRTALAQQAIGHAYLFSGDDGIGKRLMALRFAQALSCETPPSSSQPDSCGHCRACEQIDSGTYPDLLVIEPEQDKVNPQIKIDRVREIERHVIYRPLLSARKICIIDDADRLNANAANAFLKTLEDPPEHSLFILVTSQPLRLLATVRSRCLTLRFSPATPEQFQGALALQQAMAIEDAKFLSQVCGNRIGVALRTDLSELRSRHDRFFELCRHESLAHPTAVLQQAEELSKVQPFPELIDWLSHGLRDVLLMTIGTRQDILLHQSHIPLLAQIADSLTPTDIVELMDVLQTLEQAPTQNLNLQLCLENFLFRFHETIHRDAA